MLLISIKSPEYIKFNMNGRLSEKLKEIKISDYIFVIFIIISLSGIYADHKEKDELTHKDPKGNEKAHNVRMIALVVSLLIYIYFLNRKLKRRKEPMTNAFINNLDILASILFIIGGLIFIYNEYKGDSSEIILE